MLEFLDELKPYSPPPKELKRWNWGAFWLTWIWGIGNNSFVALLVLLPIANLIMPFYLGYQGNRIAWENDSYKDINQFMERQKKWAIAGWCIALISIGLIGFRIYEDIQNTKLEEVLSTEIMTYVNINEDASKYLGNTYEIIHQGFWQASSGETVIEKSFYIWLQSHNELYRIGAKLSEENEIQSIVMTQSNNDAFEPIRVLEDSN